MLQVLYPLSFFVSLSGLILWFYYQGRPTKSRLMSQLFLGGFMVYLFSLAFSDGELTQKLWVLFRDLIVLGLVSQFFSFFRKNKLAFFSMLALLYSSFYVFGFHYMQQSFVQQKEVPAETVGSHSELLVDMQEQVDFEQLQKLIKKYDLKYTKAFQPKNPGITHLDDYYLVDIAPLHEAKIDEVRKALMNTGLVDWVEHNEQIQIDPIEQVIPTRRSPTFGLNDPEVHQLWAFEAMGMDHLYRVLKKAKVKSRKKAVVAVLDTGVDATHEDLADNYRSIDKKYDRDNSGHGTHCAGIIGAVSNNKIGIASFSPDNEAVAISGIKVLDGIFGGSQASIINGMIEAADQGVDVISMSLGARSTDSRQAAYEEAVAYANKAGAIVVVAAGNSNVDAINYSPANTPGVISVSAIDTLLHRAHFSNTVSSLEMSVTAPGVSIFSTYPNNKYKVFNGTSMSAPYVAGLVGLLKSINPDLNTEEVYRILHESGKKMESGEETGRLIQAGGAVSLLLNGSLN